MFVFIFKGVKVRNYSANNIMECPVGQKSYKSIQICQIFLFFDIETLKDDSLNSYKSTLFQKNATSMC